MSGVNSPTALLFQPHIAVSWKKNEKIGWHRTDSETLTDKGNDSLGPFSQHKLPFHKFCSCFTTFSHSFSDHKRQGNGFTLDLSFQGAFWYLALWAPFLGCPEYNSVANSKISKTDPVLAIWLIKNSLWLLQNGKLRAFTILSLKQP